MPEVNWGCLLKWNDMLVKNVSTIVAAACVLHIMCEIHRHTFDWSWAGDGDRTDDLSQPNKPPHCTTASVCMYGNQRKISTSF